MSGSVEWAVELLKQAQTVEEVESILRSSVRVGANADGATVVRLEGDRCYYVDEDAMSPLWKGKRFPVRSCISGWAMLNRQTVAVDDIRLDDRIPQQAYRPTFVRSLVIVPIGGTVPIGAIGAYWADRHVATPTEMSTMRRLAAAAGAALTGLRKRDAPDQTSTATLA